MLHFEVNKRINASPARVWTILTDGKRLQDGSFGILRIDGEIKPEATIKLWASVSPGRAFPLKITDYQANRGMTWQSGMPLGLFKGVRRFTLTSAGDATDFNMREVYSGLLAPLIGKSIPDLNPSFEIFAAALKFASEGDYP